MQRRDHLAAQLLGSLRAGMILLADRNFGSGKLAVKIAATQAKFVIRVRTGRAAPGLLPFSGVQGGTHPGRI